MNVVEQMKRRAMSMASVYRVGEIVGRLMVFLLMLAGIAAAWAVLLVCGGLAIRAWHYLVGGL